MERLTANAPVESLQRSWVRSQHTSAQWNLRGGTCNSAEYTVVRKKYLKKHSGGDYTKTGDLWSYLSFQRKYSSKRIFFSISGQWPDIL
jgi:hypothetical protein